MDVIKHHHWPHVPRFLLIDVKKVDMFARMVMLIVVKNVLKKTEFTVNGMVTNVLTTVSAVAPKAATPPRPRLRRRLLPRRRRRQPQHRVHHKVAQDLVGKRSRIA